MMALRYYRLFDLLTRRGKKKTDLLKIVSSPTLAKLSKGDTVNTEIIDKLCEYLQVQPENIMEYIPNVKTNAQINEIPVEYMTPVMRIPTRTVQAAARSSNDKPPRELTYEEQLKIQNAKKVTSDEDL